MKTCTGCHQPIEPLADFPGPLCLPCYAKSQEGAPMPTAEEIVAMWGGLPANERCPVCGQPDNCGDCDHTTLTSAEIAILKDGT